MYKIMPYMAAVFLLLSLTWSGVNKNVVAQPSAAPVGVLDNTGSQVSITGFARDPDWSGAIKVKIYVDSNLFDEVTANRPYPGQGNTGFRQTHTYFGAGTHTITATAVGVNSSGFPDGDNLSLGPVSVTAIQDEENCFEYYRGSTAEWCWPGQGQEGQTSQYWTNRQRDTKRLFNQNVLAAINNSFGGTLFELYNSDRSINLLDEAGGSAMQLSLWGDDGTLPELGCNGWPITSTVINPIMAIAEECAWSGSTNDVDYSASTPYGGWTLRYDEPHMFTRQESWPGLSFYETAHVGAAWVKLDYQYVNGSLRGDTNPYGIPDQEIPAIFTRYFDDNPVVYWASGGQIQQAVIPYDSTNVGLRIPLNGTEYWWSVCGYYANRELCLTVATASLGSNGEASLHRSLPLDHHGEIYMSAIGKFRIPVNSSKSWTVYVFPYKYNAMVPGADLTVREQIYNLLFGGSDTIP